MTSEYVTSSALPRVSKISDLFPVNLTDLPLNCLCNSNVTIEQPNPPEKKGKEKKERKKETRERKKVGAKKQIISLQ